MTRQWMSERPDGAAITPRYFLLSLFIALTLNACAELPGDTSTAAIESDLADSPAALNPVSEPDTASESAQSANSEEQSNSELVQDPPSALLQSAQLITGEIGVRRFDVWICADTAARNLAYTFEANIDSMSVSGFGHEVLLSSLLSRPFRWTMPASDEIQLEFPNDDRQMQWQQLSFAKPGRLSFNNPEQGVFDCLRQRIEDPSPPRPPSQTQSPEPSETGSPAAQEALLVSELLIGDELGNQMGKPAGAPVPEKISLWVCETPTRFLAQAYFAATDLGSQGLFIEAEGINAVRHGQWMPLSAEAVRLELADQGEVILSQLNIEGRYQFSAIRDQDEFLRCDLETLDLTPPW